MAASDTRKPTWVNYWGWGSGDMLGAGAQAVVTGWLAYFFITFCGLSPIETGLILGLPRLLEAITCPLIGYISDNLRHTWIGRRIGRRKIFLLITIPLLPSFALIFVTGQTFAYYLVTFIFFEFVYTMFLIPWETLAAEMTKDYKEKAKFAGARMLIAQSSAILASYLPTLIINHFGGKDSSGTFLIMAAIFGGLFSLVVLLVVLFTWERPYTEAEKLIQPEPFDWAKAAMIPVNMFRDLFSTLRLKAFRQHLSLYLGGYISQDIFNTAFPLFVATVMLGSTLVISQAMTMMYVAQLVSVMIAIRVIIRTGPTAAYRMAISFVCAALLLFLAFYLIKPAGFAASLAGLGGDIFTAAGPRFSPTVLFWLFLPIVLAGLGRGTLNFVPWGVYNYLPDVDEAVTGQRREGIFAGVMTFVRKIAQSGAILLTTTLLGMGGFVSGAKGGAVVHQAPEALRALVLIMVGGPIVVMIAGLIVSWSFRLNARTHEVLVHEVERLRAGETEAES
ncbi:MAG: MFS transporter, partial [Caulobacter sp.]|nr:MFS transporter [Caulobacter sp.]